MKKASLAQQKKFHFYVVFVISFLILFLAAIFCIWAYINVRLYNTIRSATDSFIENDSSALYNDVFITAFDEGKKCLHLADETSKKTCHDKTSRIIAEALHEDTLLEWDQDLMFIQPEYGKLYSLGWTGEVKDITGTAHFNPQTLHVPQIFTFLTRQCHYFNVYDTSEWSCEIYIPVNYSGGTLGYVVRLAPLTEETWLVFAIFYPLILHFILSSHEVPVYIQLLVTLSIILIPGFLAYWVARMYRG